MKKSWFTAPFCLSSVTLAFIATNSPLSAKSLAESLDGEFDVRYQYYPEVQLLDRDNSRVDAQLSVEHTFKISSKAEFYIEPVVTLSTGPQIEGALDGWRELSEDRYILNMREAYFAYFGESFEVKIGKQVFSWAVADGFSPLDALNPLDVTNLPPEKIGIPSVSFRRDFSSFSAQFVWVPVFTPTRLSSTENRWFGSIEDAMKAVGSPVPPQFNREIPDSDASAMTFATRVSTSQLIEGWDFDLSFLVSREPVGVYQFNPPPVGGPPPPDYVPFTRVFPEQMELGLGFSTVVGNVEIHGETVMHQTKDDFQDDDYLESVIGGNYTWSDVPGEWCEEIFFVLEYVSEITLEDRLAGPYVNVGSYFRPFSDSITGLIEVKIDGDTKIKTTNAYRLEDGGSTHSLVLNRSFSHGIEVDLGYEHFRGDPGTPFGVWRDNNRTFCSLRWKF